MHNNPMIPMKTFVIALPFPSDSTHGYLIGERLRNESGQSSIYD
jgi:hypothetical protein